MSDNRTDLPSPSAPNFQQRLRETVQTYLGKQGNPLDRGLTLRDLLENGIVSLKKGFTLRPGQSGTLPLNPGSAVVDAYEPDLTPPPVPTGLKAAAAISHVMVEHDAPLYSQGHGHLRTRLYGAMRAAGAPAPVFSDAVEIAQFSGTIYSHPSNPATAWHFWAKWETVDGVLSPAPAGGTNGIVATTGQDVALLLDALTGEITESQLYQGLVSRINLIDDPDTTANSVAARILTEAQARQAAITAEATTRQTADSSLAQEVATLTATINAADATLSAAIQGEATARANADTAEAQARETLVARVTGAEGAISSQAVQISNRYTKAETDSVISSSTQALSASYQAADAATLESAKSYANAGILSEQTARANADSALASSITTLGATVNSNNTMLSAAVQSEAEARANQTGDLFAKYTVKVDLNGYVSGFGLASAANNSTPSSSFAIRADRFYIANPSGPGIAPSMPFIVQATPTTINGVEVPVGVYMRDAFIQNGTITNAKIANLAVDDAKIANLSVGKLTAGSLSVGEWIASSNFVSGQQGWAIWGNGHAELGAASIRGQLAASQINTEGLTIKQNGQVILGAGASLPAQFVTPDGGWLNSNLVPSIDAAATTAIWSNVSGTGRPADGATAGSNLIKKSVFTDGSMGGWNANLACAGCYGGASEMQTTSRDTLEIGNIFVVTPGETLYAAGDVYTLNSDYGATVGAAFIDAAGNYISWQGAGKGPRESWSRVYGTLIAPANAVFGIPWIQINGPGGEVLPYVAYSRLYLGRQQEGATVGAPTGTYVGDTLAQNVESLAGAQVKADAAANWAVSTAQTYAAAKADLARINAEAHADGIVSAAEQRAISDASNKAEAARVAAISAAAADATEKANIAAIGDNLFVGNLANITGSLSGGVISITGQVDPRGGTTAVNVKLPTTFSYVYYRVFNQEGRSPGWYIASLKLLVVAGMSIVVTATDGSSWNSSEYKVATTTSNTPVWVTCVVRQYVGANAAGLDVVIGSYHKGTPVSSLPSYVEVRISDLYVYADRYEGDVNATVGAPAGTYVGDTPAQSVESQSGAQSRADAAANWAVSAAQTYAAAQAELARINANAHADGIVTAAEQRSINDASAKAEAARVAAVNAAAADATAKANVAATTANWSGVAQRPMDISNLIRKGVFDDGQPGTWTYAGIEDRINSGMPYAKNIYFHGRDNLENGSDFPVTPGETIYGAAWFETQGITDYHCYLGLFVFNASGGIVQYLTICGISPNTGWRYVTGSGVIAAGGVRAIPWVQMGGFDFPAAYQWLRASGLWLGRHAPGATVGAPAGTYVGDTLAQNVESQSGAQYRADVARAGAIGVASEDASAKANWARNAAVGDVTPSINAKLNKAGDTISGRISFAVADGMFAGSDTNNGVYFGKDGLVGRKGGANTFSINTAGDAVFSGSLDAATMNSGVINLQHNGGWDWGYVRSNGKWWTDGQNGWVLARHADGSTFMEMRGGSNRFWMSSWNDCGIQFPGISMTNGGLTISQANVIDTLQIAGNAVTVSNSAVGTNPITNLYVPANENLTIIAIATCPSKIITTGGSGYSNPYLSVTVDGETSSVYQGGGLLAGESGSTVFAPATTVSLRKVVSGGAGGRTVTISSSQTQSITTTLVAFGNKR